MLEYIPYVEYVLIAVGIIVVAIVVIRSSVSKETNRINEGNIKALQTQNSLQARQITVIEQDKNELTRQVTLLTGKVDTLSKIPLDKIEKHMADTNRILQAVLPLLDRTTTEHTTTNTTRVVK
jgi:hypothetical protein